MTRFARRVKTRTRTFIPAGQIGSARMNARPTRLALSFNSMTVTVTSGNAEHVLGMGDATAAGNRFTSIPTRRITRHGAGWGGRNV